MSNSEILENLIQELKTLESEALRIQNEYQTYHAQVAEVIKKILSDAGILDEIHGIELQREEVRKKAEENINTHRSRAQDLLKVRDYLLAQIKDTAPKSDEPETDKIDQDKTETTAPVEKAVARIRPTPPRFS